jgi:hypothetical protein
MYAHRPYFHNIMAGMMLHGLGPGLSRIFRDSLEKLFSFDEPQRLKDTKFFLLVFRSSFFVLHTSSPSTSLGALSLSKGFRLHPSCLASRGAMHYTKCTIQTVLCQALFENFFNEPLRRESARGYGVPNPRISRISRIFLNFAVGILPGAAGMGATG